MHSDTVIQIISLICFLTLFPAIEPTATDDSTNNRVVTCDGLTSCPFDDLTSEEINLVVSIVKSSSNFPSDVKFPIIRMEEPKKTEWNAGLAFDQRFAYAAVFNERSNILYEVVVDLKSRQISEIIEMEDGIAPPLLMDEYEQTENIIRANVEFEAAVRRRGLEPSTVVFDTWAPGRLYNKTDTGPGKRVVRAICYYKDPKSRFAFWSVVEGLIVNVDLVTQSVIELWDTIETTNMTSGIEELPDFSAKPPLKPLLISQPEGSSIQVQGHQISWYKWKMQYSVHPIFGLQLHHVRYQADCFERLVFYKIAMAEMFVPYGAKGKTWRWRSAFDAGEYGIGKNVNPLKIGVDLPENAIMFNCTLADESGAGSQTVEGCVAAYEKDVGILYKHSDLVTNDIDGRRGRVLVITLMTTIANYDYTFDYIFHQDGTVEIRNRLSGIILTRGSPEPQNSENCLEDCAGFLNDYLIGPPHQHYFSYRIDLDVDGVQNYAAEVNLTPDPIDPEGNPDGGAFSARKQLIPSEGHHDHDFYQSRSWHIINSNSRNEFGSPRGYALKPETVAYTYLPDDNEFLQHAKFVRHPVWFTVYKDNEHTPAHRFPRASIPNEGLPKYVNDTESLLNSDIVMWYTYGVSHTTRPEEWPIMNIHTGGFTIIPYNFLSQNSEMPLKDKCP